jgi:hypothetical protein
MSPAEPDRKDQMSPAEPDRKDRMSPTPPSAARYHAAECRALPRRRVPNTYVNTYLNTYLNTYSNAASGAVVRTRLSEYPYSL